MYPAFTTTRPRLPSVLSVSQPLEQYRAELSKRVPLLYTRSMMVSVSGEPDYRIEAISSREIGQNQRACVLGDAVATLEPLDAYLAHLLLDSHPGEPAFLDLASESTAGASALVGLLHPRQPRVLAAGGPLPGDRRAYRGVVEDFLQRQGQSLSRLQWLSGNEPTLDLHGETDVLVIVEGSRPAVDVEVERWLNALPSAVVLVFGLGAVGDCAAIDALLRRFPSGSRRRVALLRDCGEVLSASRLGLVADRDNAAVQVALSRLQQLFTSNYSFLGLLRSVTEQAIRSTTNDTAVRESGHVLFLDWNQEINQLKQEAQQARAAAAARTEELHALQNSANYRLGEQLRQWRRQLAPERTWRYRLFRLLRRAAQIRRQAGFRGLLQRIVRRVLRGRA